MVAASLPVNIQDRVRLEGHNATVRYIGEVLGQAGDWVGLEWDVESRGKNDGSVKGHQYFRCRGQSGSFIRLQKFLQTADKGKTILQAVSERYRPDAHEEDLSISTVTRKQLQVKLVGRAKAHARQGQLDSLQAANVSSAGISSTERAADVAQALPCLEELDLSDNLLGAWSEVAKLAQGLVKLRLLNLSRNSLQYPTSPGCDVPFSALETLVLNSTGIVWEEVQRIQDAVPLLTELHLCCNCLPVPEQSILGFQALQVLDLTDNKLDSWEGIARLGDLPSLSHLHLTKNGIPEAHSPAGSESFRSLQALFLAENQLSAWSSVDALNGFPSLQEARLTANPLFSGLHSASRAEVIARVAGLTRLNGSSISASERRDAELQYLRQVLGELEEARSLPAQISRIRAKHPRLDSLSQWFGNVGAATVNHARGSTMRVGMVQLTLSCALTGVKHTKKLPGSMTVAKLKVLCQRLFQIPVAAQILVLHECATSSHISADEGRDLAFYDIQGSAELEISQADLQAASAAAAEAKQLANTAHEQRMQQHDRNIDLMKAVQEHQYKAHQPRS